MEYKIQKFLLKHRVKPSLLGFYYIPQAVEIILKANFTKIKVVDEIYNSIAMEDKTTTRSVERAIRHLITTMPEEALEELEINSRENSTVLYALALKFREDYKSDKN